MNNNTFHFHFICSFLLSAIPNFTFSDYYDFENPRINKNLLRVRRRSYAGGFERYVPIAGCQCYLL